jgi:isopentenyl-diphosphate delta-isomerase
MTATEYVILVDDQDQQVGIATKLEAHEKNLLHRAFSIFIFREHNGLEVLLQQRALHKYHSPGLWTNACCSHPRPGESILEAGQRRLDEELGFHTPLENVGWFKYNAHFSNGLSEHEIDHVLVGHIGIQTGIKPNPEEVHTYRWLGIEAVKQEFAADQDRFTPWFAEALELGLSSL